MKRFLRFVFVTLVALTVGVLSMSAQASYNFTYNSGVTVAAGSDYFLYNIGAGKFLTNGMDWGTHATVDNAGRKITLATVGNGAYSIYTEYYSRNNNTAAKSGYMTTNGYVDTGSNDANWEFTPVSLSGYTNAYTIKNGSDFLYYDSSDARVQVGANTGNNYSYWLLIPIATRQSDQDYTYYLANTDFNRGGSGGNQQPVWSGSHSVGGLATNRCAERYHATLDFYQTIEQSVPEGRYKFWCQGFWRQDGSDAGPVLYANNDTKTLGERTGTENTMDAVSAAFTSGLYNGNNVETFVNNGSLRVGINITSGSQWVIWDNFVLQYIGKVVMDYAEALPTGNMTRDTWYYFDIAVAGDYTLTASDLTQIKYTTDGYTLITDSPSSMWRTATVTLAAGRYYIKSDNAQSLSVDAASYTYNVGAATISRTCVQGGETITVSYPDALTNSGESLTINTNGITFNGNALTNPTTTSNGFTFDIPTGLAAGASFTLSIPAGAVGYTNGNTFNSAESFTITTPALFDGTYFLKVGATTQNLSTQNEYTEHVGMYLSRGTDWGTHAAIDNYGLAFQVSTDADNYTLLKIYDTQRYYTTDESENNLYDVWADQGGNKYIITKLGNRLLISASKTPNKYFKANANETKLYCDGDGSDGFVLLFEAEDASTHAAVMAARKDAQAAAAATAADAGDYATYGSLSGVTTKAQLEAAVANMYSRVIVGGQAPTTVSEKYQGAQPNPTPETVYSGTLEIPSQGLYKFSMQAFYRAGSNERTQAMHTDGVDFPPVVLFLGDAETQIKSLYDEQGGTTNYVAGNDAQYNGMYYANNMDAALMMFQEGKYHNEVWAYFPAAGTYTYGVKYLGHANANAQWFIYSPEAVTVTYYGVDDSYFEKLKGEIAKANAINSEWNDGTLQSEIANAQHMYDEYSANQSEVNAEVAALQAKYPSTTVSVANGTFDTNPVFLADGTTASGAVQTISNNGSLYEVSNWSNTQSGNEWVYGANAEYGSTATVNGVTPPAKDMFGEATGAALGLSAGWSHDVVYSQDVTIPSAGKYLIYYEAFNKHTETTIDANKTGIDGTFSTKDEFTEGEWTTDVVAVNIYNPGTYTLSVGMGTDGHGSGSFAKLWIDNVEIYRIGDAPATLTVENGIVTVVGEVAPVTGNVVIADINNALTADIAVLNIQKASGLNNVQIDNYYNENLLIYANSTSQVANTVNVIANGTCANLVLKKSSSPFLVPAAFTATRARYTVASGDLAGGEYATLMIPFEGYTSLGDIYTLDQGVKVVGGEIDATALDVVPANSPVLITGSGQITNSNVAVAAIANGQTFTNGELVGVYQTTQAPVGSYVLQNHTSSPNGVAFYLVGDYQPNVGPFRAYIRSQSGNAKALRVNFGESTSIAIIDADGNMTFEGAEYYTVGGARLNAPQKGLNIVKFANGTVKKIIIK